MSEVPGGAQQMIKASDMKKWAWAEPFRPYRVYLKDGRHFDVPNPRWTLVGEPVVILPIPSEVDPRQTVPEHTEMVFYREIDRVEPLPDDAAVK
jgi:hypothetical protein